MFGKETIVVAIKLFVITAIAALCLAFVNKVTAPIIAENSEKAQTEALRGVLSDAGEFKKSATTFESSDNSVTIDSVNIGFSNSEVVGYAVTVTSNAGYGGDVKVMVGIDKDLAVTDIEILESSETAGLGANASKPKFKDQFEGAKGNLSVVKGVAQNGEISAIASATITSKAVTSCVNAALVAAGELEKSDAAENAVQTEKKLEEIKQETEKQIGNMTEGEGE
ncbi:MAG: RnfABCDGE type electron transport complex subunit G [Clostridia bacterium]|nr:RnfABCDGE type electron transport complex subunit G [Clostridia bacterium]